MIVVRAKRAQGRAQRKTTVGPPHKALAQTAPPRYPEGSPFIELKSRVAALEAVIEEILVAAQETLREAPDDGKAPSLNQK